MTSRVGHPTLYCVTDETAHNVPAGSAGPRGTADVRLVQVERLDAIGQFAGGVAHEFNNLLTTIRGFSDLALARLHPDDPTRGDIDAVIESADRAAGVVRALLAFARRQTLAPVDVDPGRVVSDLVPMLEQLLGDDVAVVVDVAEPRAWVRVDPTQLERVILELAMNARDSMTDGGTLTISVRNVGAFGPTGLEPGDHVGPSVRISVTDTGPGMDEWTRARIFEPYFTTKTRGLGTGLGMASVFGIVTQSHGRIEIETSLGVGSTIHVDLPQVTPHGGTPAQLRVLPEFVPEVASGAVVLVVDDEDTVRQVVRRMLESAGYAVIEAPGAAAAVRESEGYDGVIHVLLSDIVMPGMHGHELAAALRRGRPDIQVILMSGYVGGADARAAAGDLDPALIAKPFSAAALRAIVGQAVARTASGIDRPAQRSQDAIAPWP